MGRIEETEEPEHPGRHVLTRVLGVEADVAPDVVEFEPRMGDRVLLCSDGLSNELDEPGLHSLLEVGAPSDAARALVAAANAHGGLDNITAVVADVVAHADGSAAGAPDVALVADGHAAGTVDPATQPEHDGPTGSSSAASEGSAVSAGDAPVTAAVAVLERPAPARPGVPLPGVPLRPALTVREQRRRRRHERRTRRAHNKWVSIRGAVFLCALASVVVASFYVLRWYGTSNYIVTVHSRHIVIEQGQQGGFLWWPEKVVRRFDFGPAQVLPEARPDLASGVNQPSLTAALHYVAELHAQWRTHHLTPTSTATTTTYAPYTAVQG